MLNQLAGAVPGARALFLGVRRLSLQVLSIAPSVLVSGDGRRPNGAAGMGQGLKKSSSLKDVSCPMGGGCGLVKGEQLAAHVVIPVSKNGRLLPRPHSGGLCAMRIQFLV